MEYTEEQIQAAADFLETECHLPTMSWRNPAGERYWRIEMAMAMGTDEKMVAEAKQRAWLLMEKGRRAEQFFNYVYN